MTNNTLRTITVFVLLTACSATLFAGSDYGGSDFSVRLPPAFVRFTEVTAMDGGSAASRMSSAINPAAVDWLDIPGKHGITVAPYYSGVCLGNGTWLNITGQSVTVDAGELGSFQPTLAQIRSNRAETRQGLGFDYRVDTMMIQWGKRFGSLGIGACFNFNEAEIVQKAGSIRVSESHAESYRFRFGALWEPAEKWLIGIVAEYGFAPYRAKANVFVFPIGFVEVKSAGVAHQFILRPGVSYEYAENSIVFFDYQFGAFENDEDRLVRPGLERLLSHRFSAGVNHQLFQWLFVQGGASVDVRGNCGLTTGFNVFFSENAMLSLGYQYNTLPELRPEFGDSHTIQATFSLMF